MSEPMPILSRVERLDLMMGYMEEKRLGRGISDNDSRVKRRDSCASTRSTSSSGNTGSNGGNSSVTSSPKSLEKKCRPIDDVVTETQLKGNLIDRVHHLEIRLLKLEQDLVDKEIRGEDEEEEEAAARMDTSSTKKNNKKHRKGLKSLVRSCIKGKLDTKA